MRRLTDPFPVSLLGVFVCVASWFALERFAFAQMDVVLLVVGWSGIGLVGLAALMVITAALILKIPARRIRREGPLAIETTQPTHTGFRLPSLAWLPLVQVRWEWERPAGVAVTPVRSFGRLSEEATLFDRGEVKGVRRRIVVSDALGLARIGLRKDDPVVIEALPHAGALRRLPILSSLAGGDEIPHPMGIEDGDRVELRRYVPGDPARFIHWKIFGRTRKLMVRVPERALTRARRTVAYLVAGPDDDATAAAARVAVEGDAFGGEWVFGADGDLEDGQGSPQAGAVHPCGVRAEGAGGPRTRQNAGASTVADAVQRIVRSSAARARGGIGLAAFVDRAERSGPAALVVFAPPRPGPWLDRVVAVARRRPRGMRVVIGVDGLAHADRPRWWKRLLSAQKPVRGVPNAELDEVLRPLVASRCEVLIFDRPSGRQLGAGRSQVVRPPSVGRAA